jgi:uncharacterized protein
MESKAKTGKFEIIDTCARPMPPETGRLLKSAPAYYHVYKMFKSEKVLDGIPLPDMLAEMDEAGISKAVMTGLDVETTVGFKISNDSIAEVVSQYPERFIGGVGVDPFKGMDAVREIERCVRDYGFKMAKIVPYAHGIPANDRRYYPIYAKCVELDIAIWTQVGHTATMLPSEPGRPIYLDTVALEFPELRILAAHIGWPWTEEMIALSWKHPNLYIETSAHPPNHFQPELLRFMKSFGKEKVIFGTDYPLLSWKRCVADLEKLDLPEESMRNFLSGNARRALKLA